MIDVNVLFEKNIVLVLPNSHEIRIEGSAKMAIL